MGSDRIKQTPMCPSCGNLMQLARVEPVFGIYAGLVIYDCRQCGVALSQAGVETTRPPLLLVSVRRPPAAAIRLPTHLFRCPQDHGQPLWRFSEALLLPYRLRRLTRTSSPLSRGTGPLRRKSVAVQIRAWSVARQMAPRSRSKKVRAHDLKRTNVSRRHRFELIERHISQRWWQVRAPTKSSSTQASPAKKP